MGKNAYELTGWAMNDLHERSHSKMHRLFPDRPPYDIVRRINREVETLWGSPYAYALLIADDAIKALRAKRICPWLTGDWENSYYGFLMDIVERDPLTLGRDAPFADSPIRIRIPSQHGQQCLEQLLLAAQRFGFYLRKAQDHWLLLDANEKSNSEAPEIWIEYSI